MMMSQKRLHELLREDQEPFLLRTCEIKRPNPPPTTTTTPHLQLTKRLRKPPVSQVSNFPPNFCKNACFYSFNGSTNSPDPTKSPLFTFQSPLKSPCRKSNNSNTILLHIPARTATLLLEAALRIQKQSSEPQKPKNSNGFGLFGSLLKRLTHRSKPRRKQISGDGVKLSVKDILRWDSSVGRKSPTIYEETERENEVEVILINEDKGVCEKTSSFSNCSCNGSRPSSSAAWSSESSNEGKSMETSSGSLSGEDVSFAFNQVINNTIDFATFDKHFCESPFHFVLQSTTPSSGDRTPDFNSPATSPRQRKIEEEQNDVEKLIKFQLDRNGGGGEEEEEEDKEQCSPVSVLDPPFEDDDEAHDEDDNDDDGDDFDQLECSYAIVQRAKHQLLQKLRRFEKLAGLDPVELEKRMLEQEEEVGSDDNSNETNDFEEEEEELPNDIKKLVSDLINEEERKQSSMSNQEATMKKVWKKLESWKEVESNTIDMMVEQDFQREVDEWKRNPEQVKDAVVEIEIDIFRLLVEELSEELISF